MKKMNHTTYPRALRSKSVEQLRFIIKDAGEALRAMPDGENAGYYSDEINYAAMELRLRGMS
jgi:hypothetical protein